jgi:hypothetical protein
MLVISDKRVCIEHVMWQPTGWCDKNCTGCYAKKHQGSAGRFESTNGGSSTRWPWSVAEDLLILLESDQLVCDQFTVAIDDLSLIGEADLIKCFQRLWRLAALRPSWLCVTMSDVGTVVRYLNSMGLTAKEFFQPVSMASFSVCPSMREVDEYGLAGKINIQARDVGWKPQIIPPLTEVNHVYALLTKPPLGEEVDPSRIRAFLATLKNLKDEKNVTPDVCMTDAVRYIKEGLHCGAGINKIAVWPYGHVTGCPYDVIVTRKPEAKLMDEILKVVRGEKDSILRCDIPRALKEYKCPTKQQTLKPSKL